MFFLAVVFVGGCPSDPPALCEPPGTQVADPFAAGCIAVHDGRLLMIQGQDGRWSIPAGKIESGESTAQAALRETREEAGVAVTVGDPFCAVPSKSFVAHICTVAGDATPKPDGD